MNYKLIVFGGGMAFLRLAQGSDFTLASAVVNPGGSAALGVAFTVSGPAPSGLQWTIGYSPSQFSAISVTTGPAASAGGKTLSCVSASGSVTCLVAGLNKSALGSGNMAFVNATLAPGVAAAPLQLIKAVAVDPAGQNLILASVNGGSLQAPALSALSCSPASLSAGGKSTCIVTLTQAAPSGGSIVALSSNNSLLTVPASAIVPAGATTATFTATAAGTIPASQGAAITAGFGAASQSATIGLVPALLLSSIACSPATAGSGSSIACTMTLTGPAPSAGTLVALSSSNNLLTVPASVTVPAGATVATFQATAGTILNSQSAIVTAQLGASSRTATVSLTAVVLSKLTCTPTILGRTTSATCTVFLNSAATQGGTAVTLGSNNSFLVVPSSVNVPGSATIATFSAKAGLFPATQRALVTASLNGSSAQTSLTLSTRPRYNPALQVTALSCSPDPLDPGNAATCELTVTAGSQPFPVELASNSDQVRVPAVVTTRPNQSSLKFQAEGTPVSKEHPVTLTAASGGTEVETTLRPPVVQEPVQQASANPIPLAGAPLSLEASVADAPGLSLKPQAAEIETDGRLPVLHLPAALCSPGAVATVHGKRLAAAGSHLEDPSGSSLRLGDSSVAIPGQSVPVLYSSPDRVDFVCPGFAAGTAFSLQVESVFGSSEPATTVMRAALPVLLTLTGQEQGMVFFEGSDDLAMQRNFRVPAHPAQPGDRLVLHATGLQAAEYLPLGAFTVKLSDVTVGVDFLEPLPGFAGVWAIHVRVPAAMTFGAVPVQLRLTMPGGEQLDSNPVTAFFEAVRQ